MPVPPLPTSLAAFVRTFGDEAACRATLADLRWPDGFRCPSCGGEIFWERPGREVWVCRTCRHDAYLTAGSALHRSKVPLETWFLTAYLVATTPGLNSITLARQAALSRQGTAWLLLAKLRRAMADALDTPLTGTIEADETWFGGPQAGVRGQQRAGRKALLVLVLAEARSDGRARMLRLPDNGKTTLTDRIAARVEAGATIRSDGWKGYNGLVASGFAHDRRPHPPGGMEPGSPHSTPYADQAISAAKRWILATYNKPPREQRLPRRVVLPPRVPRPGPRLRDPPAPAHRRRAIVARGDGGRGRPTGRDLRPAAHAAAQEEGRWGLTPIAFPRWSGHERVDQPDRHVR